MQSSALNHHQSKESNSQPSTIKIGPLIVRPSNTGSIRHVNPVSKNSNLKIPTQNNQISTPSPVNEADVQEICEQDISIGVNAEPSIPPEPSLSPDLNSSNINSSQNCDCLVSTKPSIKQFTVTRSICSPYPSSPTTFRIVQHPGLFTAYSTSEGKVLFQPLNFSQTFSQPSFLINNKIYSHQQQNNEEDTTTNMNVFIDPPKSIKLTVPILKKAFENSNKKRNSNISFADNHEYNEKNINSNKTEKNCIISTKSTFDINSRQKTTRSETSSTGNLEVEKKRKYTENETDGKSTEHRHDHSSHRRCKRHRCHRHHHHHHNHHHRHRSKPPSLVDTNKEKNDSNEDPLKWTCDQVYEFVSSVAGIEIADQFRAQEIDGFALSLLQSNTNDHLMMVNIMKIKLGPMLRIINKFQQLQKK